MYTWPSSTLDNFKSNETILSHPMGPYELALFGSLSSIGALVGTPMFGYLLDKIGRKYCSVIGGIPFLLAWSMIAAFNQVEVVLVALFIAGIGGSSFVISPVFVSEICQDSIRGTVTAGSVLFYNLGVLLSYILGGYLSYYVMVYVQITLSTIYIFGVSFLKDSPVYLMTKGREADAAKALAFYRSVKPDSKEVLEELCNIKRILNPESRVEHLSGTNKALHTAARHMAWDNAVRTRRGRVFMQAPEEEKLKPTALEAEPKKKISPFRYLIRTQSTRRALFVTLTMVTASIMMGMVVVQVYAAPLFSKAVPGIPTTMCTIIFAVVTISATIMAAILADRAGRKILMLCSSGCSAVITLLLAVQIQTQFGPPVLTAIFIYVFCFVFSIGAGTVPFIVVCEVFIPELKSFCSMIVLEWAWLCNFLILSMFNPLVSYLGLGPVFYIFSGVCVATTAFCFFFQPETKGLPVDVVQTLFESKKSRPNRRQGWQNATGPRPKRAPAQEAASSEIFFLTLYLIKCEWTVLQSEELDFTKSIPELPDAAPDTSVYPDPEQPQQGTSKIKKAYCEPCWLFANPASKKIQNVWMEGYDDWKHIVDAIERHETSKIHLDSCLTYQQWRLQEHSMKSRVRDQKKNLLAPSTF
ncbi:Facilitated trehalose transporter Tret1 [Eumeta japonica]|uniref:Facilitated trehalose transporter Tret1 n=1 Tax=Eumeta variegata TaxID=151549 RepID=A0A4C1XID6_EUMVA|nr:Facilitated trehalose transporter Tret1 [Eumeta japonica]